MRTDFAPERLADPEFAASQGAIRKCVHCGFCTATCPTYVLLGDERDSPRGRIELIRAMLESDAPPTASTVKHLDRCLSCLACTTTCPSGVDYAQLIGHARTHIESTYRRPLLERWLRALLPAVLTRPGRLAWALRLGRLARPLEPALASLRLAPLAALLRLTPAKAARPADRPSLRPEGHPRGRVALLQGCVEPVMAPQIRAAAVRLITRAGFEVVLADGEGCCGAISEHLGRADEARASERANLRAWAGAGELAAVVATAAGCGTRLKAYGGGPPAYDLLEFIAQVGLPPVVKAPGLAVAYHAACSLQHGQKITDLPVRLLAQAGFEVRAVPEGHLCCGSAGVYNILESEIAARLRDRKAANIARTGAKVVAAGNIGCMAQLGPVLDAAVVHPVELLDWATGGPKPAALDPVLQPPLRVSP